jgi:hypothetical protein
MESSTHSLSSLFDQLGLASDLMAIESFIKSHSPVATNVLLSDALFWTTAQASFLCEEIHNDADWAEVIDQLNTRLHSKDSLTSD